MASKINDYHWELQIWQPAIHESHGSLLDTYHTSQTDLARFPSKTITKQ